MPTDKPIQRALLSVSDKNGIVDFARELIKQDVEILSTDGTAKLLRKHQLPITEVSDYTGHPEILGGRVKSLHPKIHGGILCRPDIDQDTLTEHNILAINLVVVNLYPFTTAIRDKDCDLATTIENIDIGGPTLVRAAAKNHQYVSVVVDPTDYDSIIKLMQQQDGHIDYPKRFELAQKAFAHTAHYDAAIANYLTSRTADGEEQHFPAVFTQQFQKVSDLRYGENPHQAAALYSHSTNTPGSLTAAEQMQGKALSYNNLADADAALQCVKNLSEQPACVIVKHANPCGVAIGANLTEAYQRAFQCDKTSAFGGIIAFNQALDADTAGTILEQQFVEVILAPVIESDALSILSKKPNVRLLSIGNHIDNTHPAVIKPISGGILLQDADFHQLTEHDLKVVSQRSPTQQEVQDLLFAWHVANYVKSNAIVYAKENATIGIGAGQMSRVISARIASIKAKDAGLSISGSVMASDAFFPFRDGIDAAASAGITAIIQPGGSIRDEEIIKAADEANMAMVFTGIRHFRH